MKRRAIGILLAIAFFTIASALNGCPKHPSHQKP